jgi:hypothetical protein
MDEEVQFIMSQIDLLFEKESGTKKRKTEVPTYDFQTPTIFIYKEASSFFKLQYIVATSRKKLV